MKSFLKNETGTVAVFVAIVLPIMLGFVALATEASSWLVQEQQLQRMADASSYSGAIEKRRSDDEDQIQAFARKVADRSGLQPQDKFVTVIQDNTVSVTISRTIPRSISAIWDNAPVTIQTKAVSAVLSIPDDTICMLSLSQDASPAISFKGRVRVDLGKCTIRSNSKDDNSVEIKGAQAQITAGCINTLGSFSSDIGNQAITECENNGTQKTPVQDPYIETDFPDFSDYARYATDVSVINGDQLKCGKGNKKCRQPDILNGYYAGLPIGYFEDGLELSGDVNLDPGIYVVSRSFVVKPKANVYGENVSFILVNDATLDFQGSPYLYLRPPQDGELENILIASQDEGNRDVIGSLDASIEGVVYLPNRDIKFAGNVDLGENRCVQFVANTLEFTGKSQVSSSCNTSLPEVFSTTIRLIE